MLASIVEWVNYFFLGYFGLLNLSYLAMSLFAFAALRRYRKRLQSVRVRDMLTEEVAPPITMVVPLYNEEATCVESTRSFLGLKYPNHDVILVNDGSQDQTLDLLKDEFELEPSPRFPLVELETAEVREVFRSKQHPNLWVIDKENGGKADALNCGLKFCQTPLFCALDADTLIQQEGLIRLVRPFLDNRQTVAVGGIVRIANGCTIQSGVIKNVRLPDRLLPRLQVLEYLRAFLFGRVAWDALDTVLIISGAFGMFRRSVVVDAGGFDHETVTEDMELVVRLHRHCRAENRDYKVRFIPDPVAWTECPESMTVLGRQRDRWQRGLTGVMMKNHDLLFNPGYGRIGLLAYPYFYVFEMLGPLIEVLGYALFIASLAFGLISYTFALAFFMVSVVFGMALSISAVALTEFSFHRYESVPDLLRLMGLSFVEAFGYRQMQAWWRIKGLVSYLRGDTEWGLNPRKGFNTGD